VNPAGKITSIIAGMAAGADCIDDVDVIRAGGMPRLFGGVYAPATVGQLLREFTHGHTRQLASAARAHLVALARRTDCLAGIGDRCFVDIDSLLRPVYGHAKQGASFGHTKIASRQVLRKGLSPLATVISTEQAAPMVAGIRLRAGKAGSGRGAGSMVTEAINTARATGAGGEVLVRGDSAYGTSAVIGAALKAGVRFSLVLTKNPAVNRAIGSIEEKAWTPVHYPGAVLDPDTGQLISDAEVAEIGYTAFASTRHAVTARLIVRRVKDRVHGDELFPVWRYHPFFTNSVESTTDADITHRRHAIIENSVRRPHRRAVGSPTLRALRRQQRMGDLRRHHPQPAARGRHPRRAAPCRRPRRDAAHQDREHPRPPGPTPTPSHAAPTRPLALERRVEQPLEQRVRQRARATRRSLTPTTAAKARPETDTWKSWHRPAVSPRPSPTEPTPTSTKINNEVGPRIQA
jgi:hypothetical protein